MKALMLTFLFLLIASSEAKIFSRCELASIMIKNGLDRYEGLLDKWICIAYHASKYNTQAVAGPDEYGTRNYGILWIGSDRWCKDDLISSENYCMKPCSAFTDDDIKDDIICAKTIAGDFDPLRFWSPWKKNCRGPDMRKWSSGCRR